MVRQSWRVGVRKGRLCNIRQRIPIDAVAEVVGVIKGDLIAQWIGRGNQISGVIVTVGGSHESVGRLEPSLHGGRIQTGSPCARHVVWHIRQRGWCALVIEILSLRNLVLGAVLYRDNVRTI